MAIPIDIGTPATRKEAALRLRDAAKRANAAVETFLRWSLQLEHYPEEACRQMARAVARHTYPDPIVPMIAKEALSTIAPSAAADSLARRQKSRARRTVSEACKTSMHSGPGELADALEQAYEAGAIADLIAALRSRQRVENLRHQQRSKREKPKVDGNIIRPPFGK